MGRTIVHDLQAPGYYGGRGEGYALSRLRQVDHRTIQSIILKNVRYFLASKSKLAGFTGPDRDTRPKWDSSKLKVGDWFSEVAYYKVSSLKSDYEGVECDKHKDEIYIPKDQLPDMYAAGLYDSEQKVSRTEMVRLLMSAKECAFTVTFHKQVKVEDVIKKLKQLGL